MNIHKIARLTPHGRDLLVRQVTSGQAADRFGVAKTNPTSAATTSQAPATIHTTQLKRQQL